MEIIHGRQGPSEKRTATFVGDVWGDVVLPETDGVMINSVMFAAGGRTNWHTHGRGQILIVTSGSGLAYTRDGNGGPIGVGDVVYIPAGEEHWHGASQDAPMVHLAISIDGHDWLDPVTEAEYNPGR